MLQIKNKKVLVIGDSFVDEYLDGEVHRISQEAPVPVVLVRAMPKRSLGGAANTAANIASLGGSCVLITPVGVDEPGNWFMSEARRLNIECVSFITPKKATAKKVRVRAKGQQLVRLDYEDASTIPADEIPYTLMSCIFSHILLSDIVILSDYAKGLFSVNRLKEIIAFCYKNNRIVIADPKPKNGLGYFGASYITPNSHEMLNMMPGFADPNNAAMAYSVQMNCSVLLTKGAEGLSLITGGQVIKNWPTQAKEVFDVTGAGDTVIAAFALALASGATEEEACVFANKAAGVVVGKHGTSTVNLEEIR